jgi:hypothetical protein
MEISNLDNATVKAELQPIAHGSSYDRIYRLLSYVALLKYATQEQIQSISFPGAGKVATKKKFQALCELGYLRSGNQDPPIFSCTAKAYQILKLEKHDLKLLPAIPKGDGAEIYNTDVFIQALKLPNYYALLYPQFPKEKPYIIPDALLVLKEERRYQLNFLEIEAEKPDWDRYLQTKYDGYKRLAKDIAVYNYWKAYSGYLKLPCPPADEFKFRVIVIGKIEKNWGKGFEFRCEL